MKLNRIYAMILRNFYTFQRNYDRFFDAFYWPIMELIIWGITSTYITQMSQNVMQVTLLIISGLTFWLLVYRSQYETNVALLEDIWSRNLTNIFVSPLRFSEWIVGVVTIGIIKASLSFVTAVIVAFILYKVAIFSYTLQFIPFILLLLMTGWWVSFFISGAILRFGTKVQTFAWTLVYVLAPFSGIYYPTKILPEWAQYISSILPTTYIFEGIRQVIFHGSVNYNLIGISLLLNMVYIIAGIMFLRLSYRKLLERGMLQIY